MRHTILLSDDIWLMVCRHLGTFTLSLHWRNLGNQPVEVLIEDVYLLVVPAPTGDEDPAEEESREQAVKAERLENAEILHMRGQTEVKDGMCVACVAGTCSESSVDAPQQQGLIASLISKIVNNLQITIKNIHVRYEDKLSVPDARTDSGPPSGRTDTLYQHPFAAGLTLASLTAFSVNDQWQPAFIESTAGRVHKLSSLDSLAVYFDTDAKSIAGLPYQESIDTFNKMVCQGSCGVVVTLRLTPTQDHTDRRYRIAPVHPAACIWRRSGTHIYASDAPE